MLKKIANISGGSALDKKAQKAINGGSSQCTVDYNICALIVNRTYSFGYCFDGRCYEYGTDIP